jgi:hypothetical protein
MLPSWDYVLVVIQVLLLVGCGRLAWEAARSAAETRELVEASAGLLAELREALAESDAQAARVAEQEAVARTSNRDAVEGLARLGMEEAEIVRRLRINKGEAELLVKLGQYRGRNGRG